VELIEEGRSEQACQKPMVNGSDYCEEHQLIYMVSSSEEYDGDGGYCNNYDSDPDYTENGDETDHMKEKDSFEESLSEIDMAKDNEFSFDEGSLLLQKKPATIKPNNSTDTGAEELMRLMNFDESMPNGDKPQ